MIGLTIVRVAGSKRQGQLNHVWDMYFTVIAAEIGLMLVALTAFRELYVAKAQNRRVQKTITTLNWYHRSRNKVVSVVGRIVGRESEGSVGDEKVLIGNEIPRGTMTGVRTFVEGWGCESSTSVVDKGGV
jgi:hypothetical protein